VLELILYKKTITIRAIKDAMNNEILRVVNPIPTNPPMKKLRVNKAMLINTNAIAKSILFSICFERYDIKVIAIIKTSVRATKSNI